MPENTKICDAYSTIENLSIFKRDIWQLLRPFYEEKSDKALVSDKADGFSRIHSKQMRVRKKHFSTQRRYVLQLLFSANRIPPAWQLPLFEYICRRSTYPQARFWVALKQGVLPDEVLRPFVVDMVEHIIPGQRTTHLLRGIDAEVWIPPEKSTPETNERLVSIRPIFREARAAAKEDIPMGMFMVDAVMSARYVTNSMLDQAMDKEVAFLWLLETLVQRTSKYRRQFY